MDWMAPAQTQGAYRSGKYGKDLGAVEWILGNRMLSSYAVIIPDDAPDDGSPIESVKAKTKTCLQPPRGTTVARP
jgi:hypothetical protein